MDVSPSPSMVSIGEVIHYCYRLESMALVQTEQDCFLPSSSMVELLGCPNTHYSSHMSTLNLDQP